VLLPAKEYVLRSDLTREPSVGHSAVAAMNAASLISTEVSDAHQLVVHACSFRR
jgi:hypothetical protein